MNNCFPHIKASSNLGKQLGLTKDTTFNTIEEVEQLILSVRNRFIAENNFTVEKFNGFWTRKEVAEQTDKVFLFGDNTDDRLNTHYVPSSTQAVIRGLPNAIGIDTKKDRSTNTSSYFTDADFDVFKQQVDEAIQKAKNSGKTIVIPADGIGTGKAMLKEKAPKLFEYLQQELKKLEKEELTKPEKAPQLHEDFDLSNVRDKFKAWRTVFAGARLTGVFANFVKSLAYSIKGGLMISDKTILKPFGVSDLITDAEIERYNNLVQEIADSNKPSEEQLYELHDLRSKIEDNKGDKIVQLKVFSKAGKTYRVAPLYKSSLFLFGSRYQMLKDDLNVWKLLNGLVNAAIDNVKEQILSILNANAKTADALCGGIALGIDIKNLAVLLNTPIIKQIDNNKINDLKDSLGLSDATKDLINEKLRKGGSNFTVENLENYYLYEELSNEKKYEILRIFEYLSDVGNSINKVATAITPLKQFPTNYTSLSTIREAQNTLTENKTGILYHDFLDTVPHIKAMVDISDKLMGLIGNNLFLYSQHFMATLTEKLDNFSNPKLNSYNKEENKVLIAQQFINMLFSKILDLDDFKSTVNTDKGTFELLGARAYVQEVLAELNGIKNTYVKARKENKNIPYNIFLEGLEISIYKGYYSVRYSAGANLTAVDIYKLSAHMLSIPTMWKNGQFESTQTSEDLLTKILNLAVLSNGLSTGQNTYNRALPIHMLKDFGQKLKSELDNFKDAELLSREIERLLINVAAKFSKNLPFVSRKKATLYSYKIGEKSIYHGSFKNETIDILYDMMYTHEAGIELPNIIQSGKNFKSAYIKVYSEETATYYRLLPKHKFYSYYPVSDFSAAEYFRPDIPYVKVKNFKIRNGQVIIDMKLESKFVQDIFNQFDDGDKFFISAARVADNTDRVYVELREGRLIKLDMTEGFVRVKSEY